VDSGRQLLRAEKPVQELTRTLVCFGDSNTHGTAPMVNIDDARRFAPHERWTGILARDLGSGWHVHEEGLPGRTTVHPDPIEGEHLSGLAALPIILGTHSPIDAMVLMLGTNDLKARFALRPSDIVGGVERLLVTMRMLCHRSGGVTPRVLLVAPPPVREVGCLADMFAGGRAKSEEFAGYLARVAERHRTGFLDTGAHISSSEVDGVHFDLDQQSRLAEAIRERLLAIVPLLS